MSRAPTNDARIWAPACLPGVEALAARYVRQEFAPHRHEGVLIGIIEAGGHAVHCRGERHVAGAGTVATLDAGEVHRGGAASEGGWRQRMLYVPFATLADLAEDALDRPASEGVLHFRAPFRRDPALARTYRGLHRALETGGEPLAVQSVFEAVAGAVLARYAGLCPPAAAGVGRAGVERARDWLHAHLDRPCTLAELAQVAGLRRRQLVRAFRARHGLAPHQYLLQLRVDAACRLLAAGRPASEVAFEAGFADQSHLVRCFRAHRGATPGRYLGGGRGTNVLFPPPART